jgi:hypothetical protein
MVGGGYCQGETEAQVIEQCYQRSLTSMGSSKLWPDELEGEAYLSVLSLENQFANWTKLILAYCDGALYQGYRSMPIQYKGASLYFRGSKLFKAQLAYI